MHARKWKYGAGTALALVLSLGAVLVGCERTDFLGTWEVNSGKTLSQYEQVPSGYQPMNLPEFQVYLGDIFSERAYNFTTRPPRRPEWGETNFDGTIEIRRKEGWQFFGAWRAETNAPGSLKVFAYTVNSGTYYMAAGSVRIGTNELIWTGLQLPEDKAMFLHRKR